MSKIVYFDKALHQVLTHSTGNTKTLEILNKATQKDVHDIGFEHSGRNVAHMAVKAADQKVFELNLTQFKTEESKPTEEPKPLKADANKEEETSNEF